MKLQLNKNKNKESHFFISQTEYCAGDCDYVIIYHGSNEQSTEIDKLTGNLGSFVLWSTGNSLFVKFKSDGIGGFYGFIATVHYSNSYFNI